MVESKDDRRNVEIFAKEGAPVVSTNDGEVKKIGVSKKLGRYVVVQDVYGNRYTYAGLGSVAKTYAAPRRDVAERGVSAKALKANRGRKDPSPRRAASAGRQPRPSAKGPPARRTASAPRPEAAGQGAPVRAPGDARRPRERRPGPAAGARRAEGVSTYDGYARPVKLDTKRFKLRRLKVGAHVMAGAPLGTRRQARLDKRAAHLRFAIRPAGKGAPSIDPKPILDGWKLLEATSIYRASGRNALRDSDDGYSIGQIILMPKPALQKRVLGDHRIELYEGGREDIRTGQIDRRVLATLAYLAESGLKPSVSSLKGNHGYLTASGNVSAHSSGNAVDISRINGVPILGHQERGGIAEQTVRQLMRLQGTLEPDQIISLLDMGANTMKMGDHADHIHVGFKPRFGTNSKLPSRPAPSCGPASGRSCSSAWRRSRTRWCRRSRRSTRSR